VAALVVMFERPMQKLLTLAQDAERYHVNLLPGLCVLAGALCYHEYRKRKSAPAAAVAVPPPAAAADTASEPSSPCLQDARTTCSSSWRLAAPSKYGAGARVRRTATAAWRSDAP
jgi:hypothetical protein